MREQEIARLFYREIIKLPEDDQANSLEKVAGLYRLLQHLMMERTQAERLHFSTLFARMAYAFQKYELERSLQSHLHAFRKQAQMLQAHPEKKGLDPSDLFDYGLSVLALGIRSFYGTPIPAELKLRMLPELPSRQRSAAATSFRSKVRVILLSDDPSREQLVAREEDQPDQLIRIQYNLADRNENFNPSVQALRAYFPLPTHANLLDVEIDPEGVYRPAAMVLEPDFLLDVTAVAECFKPEGSHPLGYLLKKYLPFRTTKYLLLGAIANFFLDELMSKPEATFKATFPKVFRLNPLGFSLLEDREIRELMQKSQLHFLNLKQILAKEFPEKGIVAEESFLEPTFYSETHGLQGRLDVFHRSEKTAAIVELKSGKAYRPNVYGLSSNHFTQTLLYDLMVRAAFDNRLDPVKYILYSALQERPLRYAPRVKAQQWEALQVRNQLMAIECRLAGTYANENGPPLEDSPAALLFQLLSPARFPQLSGFSREDLRTFEEAYRGLSTLEKKYFLAFSGFIAREHRHAKTGTQGVRSSSGQAGLWLHHFREKDEAYEILSHLQLVDNQAKMEEPLLRFRRTAGKTNTLANFRNGDIAVLYPDTPGGGPLSGQLFKCTIIELNAEEVCIRLRYQQFNDRIFEEHEHWNLEHDLLDSSFNGMYRSLFAFTTSGKEKRELLLGLRPPEISGNEEVTPPKELTDEQQKIFRQMVQARDYFLLWGPPGTGKTSMMLKHCVHWLLTNTSENLLLLAYTNRAVDEICESLERIGAEYLRIGSTYSTGKRFRERLLGQQISSAGSRQEIRELIKGQRIFAGTVASFTGKQELLQLKSFDRVIIDEASQILEPMLMGILGSFRRFILIGDHQQLPAVVVQDEADSAVADPSLQKIGLHNMRNSLFERLYHRCLEKGWDWALARLSQQGRMHRDLMEFPNRRFYDGQLQVLPSSADPQQRQLKALPWQAKTDGSPMEKLLCQRRVLFLPTKADGRLSHSKTNLDEAETIARLLHAYQNLFKINDLSWQPESLGIITPYRAQIAQIQEVLHREGIDRTLFTIDTVERYQGGARDIVILSLCTNSAYQIESMISLSSEGIDRKLNVALTRAREQVLILGNPELLEGNETYRELMEVGLDLNQNQN